MHPSPIRLICLSPLFSAHCHICHLNLTGPARRVSEMKGQSAPEASEGEIELSQLVVALVVEVPDAVTEVERDELRHPNAADRAHRPAELGPGPETPDVASDVDPQFLP